METIAITHIGMDVHKKQHTIAYFDLVTNEIKNFSINNTAKDVKKMVKTFAKRSPGEVVFYYEAGCLGFGLKRQIEEFGAKCKVIAPSMIPYKPGEKIKTDKRDAKNLLRYAEVGQLTEVNPPNAHQEAIRNLIRLREGAQRDLVRIKQQIGKFMLCYAFSYTGKTQWTVEHMRWLQGLDLGKPVANEVLSEMLEELKHRINRSKELTKRIEEIAKTKEFRKRVGMLCSFKGIDIITAMTILTELFGFERFRDPKQLMGYLGLVPSEYSSGEKRNTGGITKSGNGRIRKILIQAAWHQRHKPIVSDALKKRRKGQDSWVIDLSNKCMKRLYKRYWHLSSEKGKSNHVAVTAVAREFAGFIWNLLYTELAIVPEEECNAK